MSKKFKETKISKRDLKKASGGGKKLADGMTKKQHKEYVRNRGEMPGDYS